MSDFCSTWRNQTSHPLIDFKACRCAGEDLSGFSAHAGCTHSAARVAGILAPFVIIVAVLCWFRGVKKGLGDIFLCNIAIVWAFILLLQWLLRSLMKLLMKLLKWLEVYIGACLDRAFCHPRIKALRLRAIEWSRPMTSIAQNPILPRELCDIIIAFCEDQSLLLSCSLVCAAWVPASRKQLHMQLQFRSRERAVRLIHILRSPLETLSPWVECTDIEFGGKSYHQQWRLILLLKLKGFHPQSATIWRRGRLTPHLLRTFPDVQSLIFHDVPCDNDPKNLLNYDQPRELCTLLATVMLFKHLRSLTIELDAGDIFLSNHPPNTSETLPVSRLSLGGTWCNSLFVWLQSRCHRLETLDIHTIGGWSGGIWSSVFVLNLLMRSNWETLKHLHLVVSSVDAPLDLSPLKNLTSIHLSFDLASLASSSGDCAVKTLQTVNRLHRLKELVLRTSTGHFTESHETTFDEIIAGTLGLTPVTKESNLYSYVRIAVT